MLYKIFLLGAAALIATVSAAPVETVEQAPAYTLRCNGLDLNTFDIDKSITDIFTQWSDIRVSPDSSVQLAKHCDSPSKACAYISLREENNKGGDIKANVVAQGALAVLNACQSKGGSGPALDHPNFVVHIADRYV